MSAIAFRNVSKAFSLSAERALLRHHLSALLGRRSRQLFYALRDVSFTVNPGESLGVVGANGAGKSTLLSVVCGICPPDAGEVVVNGRVAALLELGSGFHPDLTGAENLRLNASLLGLTRRRTEELFEAIVDFSGIGDFIHEPLRTYSAGMVVRLAFSVAVHVEPDILVLDEIIAVGDEAFQAKCSEKMLSFRRQGKTILLASHSPAALRQICDRALWLDHGQLIMDGEVGEVLEAYHGRATAPLGHGE